MPTTRDGAFGPSLPYADHVRQCRIGPAVPLDGLRAPGIWYVDRRTRSECLLRSAVRGRRLRSDFLPFGACTGLLWCSAARQRFHAACTRAHARLPGDEPGSGAAPETHRFHARIIRVSEKRVRGRFFMQGLAFVFLFLVWFRLAQLLFALSFPATAELDVQGLVDATFFTADGLVFLALLSGARCRRGGAGVRRRSGRLADADPSAGWHGRGDRDQLHGGDAQPADDGAVGRDSCCADGGRHGGVLYRSGRSPCRSRGMRRGTPIVRWLRRRVSSPPAADFAGA